MEENKKDFAIINYWWCDDHGAILTAYALQTFLNKEGYSSDLLKSGRNFDDNKRDSGISKLFETKYMTSSKSVYSTYEDLYEGENNRKINEKYVGFITGSDQVFRPEYVPDSWFLTFVKGKGKIAAAASFGTDIFMCDDSIRVDRITRSLRSFDYVSVREDSGVDICNNVFGIEAFHMLDPVFLIDKDEYEKVSKNSKIKNGGEYIFCYVRDMSNHTKNIIKDMKVFYHLDIVMCHEHMIVEDFLYYVANCKYMITDSYHGMCFSIIFNKDFLCLRNVMRGKARFESLQKQIGLKDENFIDESEKREFIPSIDYSKINKNLKSLSEKGTEWLKMALKKTYNKYK